MKKLVPEGAEKLEHTVLAEGEATGHKHMAFGEGATLWMHSNVMFLEAPAPTTIKHEEHKEVTVDPDVYKVGSVKEYDHFDEEARAVRD